MSHFLAYSAVCKNLLLMLGGANVARLKNEIIRKKLKFSILWIL